MRNYIPANWERLLQDAIPEATKRLDFKIAFRDFVEELIEAKAYDELDEFINDTLASLREDAERLVKERRQARVYRIYGYIAPAAIPVVIGILTGTIQII